MNRFIIPVPFLLAGLSGQVAAASLDEYVAACAQNQGNRMGPEVCRCVGNDTLDKYGQAGLDFMYYTESKQSGKLHQAMAGLDQQQKMGLMMFKMTAPSACAGKVAQGNSQSQQTTNKGSAAATGSAAGGAAASSMSSSESAGDAAR